MYKKSFKHFKQLKKITHIYIIYILYIKMSDEFDFFSNDCNNWNYNPYINTPNIDPYNLKRTINIAGNNSYNMMKYNAVIMLIERESQRERESERE